MKIMNRVCAGVLACACVLCVSPVQAKGATLVKEGQTITESVKNIEKKKYKIVLKQNSFVKVKAKNCIVSGENGASKMTSEETLPAAKGTYDLLVFTSKKSGNASFSYKITGKVKSSFKNSKNTSEAKAYAISFNKNYNGFLDNAFEEQYYKVNVPSAGKVKVTFPRAKKYQDNSYCFTNDQKKTKDPASVVYGAETFKVKKGTYYFAMTSSSAAYDYTFKLKFTK